MKTTVLAFGRLSPPTQGHEKLVNKVKDVAKEHGGDHKIILSHTQDAKKNPLHVAKVLLKNIQHFSIKLRSCLILV